ncbi:MAG: 30S ribosomal protein S6 [Bacteroidetes bacterium]|nr:30S ribosomal protein S6 [Bacteroidota bacterium]MBS1628483.1 30S ribosomal protein S6 [Bacteroidota bacterium]
MATANNTDQKLQSYELMIIFTPVLADEDFKNAQTKYTDLVTNNGGSIVATEPIGLRNLAYPIAKKTTGLYWLMEYQAPTALNHTLEVQMGRDENIIRQMITRLDKHAVAYNDRRRKGIKLEHTPKRAAEEVETEENA